MMRRLRVRLGALMVLALPLMAPAQTVAVPEHVPSDIRAYATLRAPAELWAAYSQSALHREATKFIELPQVQRDTGFQQMQLVLDKVALELGFEVTPGQLLGEHLKGADLYMLGDEAGGVTRALVVARFADEARARAVADAVLAHVRRESDERVEVGGQPLEFAESQVAGVTVTSIAEYGVHLAGKGDVVLVGSELAAVEQALTSTGAARLLEDATVVEAFADLPERDAHVALFATDGFLATLADRSGRGGLLPAGALPRALAATVRMTPARLEVAAASSGVQRTGATLALTQLPQSDHAALLRFASGNPIVASSFATFDGALLLEAANERAAGDPTARQSIASVLAGMEGGFESIGLSLNDDVLPAFGPSGGVFLNAFDFSNFMAPNLDFVLALQVRDAEKAERVTAAVEQALLSAMGQQARSMGMPAPSIVTDTHAGTTIRSIPFQHPLLTLPLAPAHATTGDGYLLVSLTSVALRGALDRAGAESAALASSASWQAARPVLLPQFHEYSLVDLRRLSASLAAVVPLALAQMQGSPEDRAALVQSLSLLGSVGTAHVTTAKSAHGAQARLALVMD